MPQTLKWYGAEVEAKAHAAAESGLQHAAEHLLEESRRIVPIDTGILSKSGVASHEGTTAAVSYDTPYAVAVHEDMTAAHQPGRQAKYLETPLNELHDKLLGIVADEIRRSLGS